MSSPEESFKAELRQRIYNFPQRFGLRHERVAAMRHQLRIWLLTELTGEYASYLFGDAPIETQAARPVAEWLPAAAGMSHSHHGRPCARKLERGEPTHRCLTCGLDDTCVLCKYCFNPEDHEGHNVFVKISSRDDGGICDCGDAEAWTRDVHCLADRGPQESRPLPADFVKRATCVLDLMLDYVVDVLDCASLATQTTRSAAAIVKLSETSELNTDHYGVPPRDHAALETKKKWCLTVWDDDKRSITDLKPSLQLATERSDDFLQMVLRRIQSAGRATVAVSSSLDEIMAVRKKIKHFTTSIRSVEDIMREEMAHEIINLAVDLCHCQVQKAEPSSIVTLIGEALLRDWSPGSKTRDSMLSMMLLNEPPEHHALVYAMSDLKDLSRDIPDEDWENYLRSELGDDDGDIIAPPGVSLDSDEELFGPKNLFGRLAQDLSEFLQRDAPTELQNWPVEQTNARVKFLIFFDVRLYKSLRQKLTDLYVAALVSNPHLKMQMAAVYADVYPLLVDQYTHIDRDPDLSVTMALSTQLFTTPSIATALIATDAFPVYMKMMYKLFAKRGKLNPRIFRNRRLGQVFHEFGYLMWRNTKKEAVGSDPLRIESTGSFLALFQGLAPMQRQTDQHVEYENERWVYCYATMPSALQLARSVAVGIDCSVKKGLFLADKCIEVIAKGLRHWQHALETEINADPVTYHTAYGRLRLPDTRLSGISVAKHPISLLHPLHCFMSWLIQFSTINDAARLRQALMIEEPDDCTLFDAPMCTLAALSQISVGYWVRNGYAMRIQLQCYRDTTLRDLAYSRDIFLTQVALCILDPHTVFMNLVHRFGMDKWPSATLGDEQQAFYMLDEFLHCLTFLLCDRLKFQGMEGVELKRATLQKEILQVLGFETMPYSEITRIAPESMSIDEHFDMVLAECANFTPPKGAHGVGMYALKPEYYDKFDPQYTHYTIARTEEAEKAVEVKLGSTHLPEILPLEGAWGNLGMFTRTASFAQFIFDTLSKLLEVDESQADQTLSRMIHLLLMAAKNDLQVVSGDSYMEECDGDGVSEGSCFSSVADMISAPRVLDDYSGNRNSILALLLAILNNFKYSALHLRVRMLFELLHEKDSRITLPAAPEGAAQNGITEEQLKRKEKGKAMQQKILADFTQQQRSFLEANMIDDDSAAEEQEELMNEEDPANGYTFPKHCVLCRMPDDEDSIFGVLTYTSQIGIQRHFPLEDPYWVKQAFDESPSLDVPHQHSQPLQDNQLIHSSDGEAVWGPAFPKEYTNKTPIVQGCGHGVHYSCFTGFLRNQQQQRVLTRFSPENFVDGEFLCPLCRGLNNCFMPVLWNSNALDTETFLREPANASEDMRAAINGTDEPRSLAVVVQSALSTLNPKFLSAIQRHDFSDTFHSNVRNVLLEQMLRIKRTNTKSRDLDKTYGLRMVYRALACTISQVEVALRGLGHSTPFGGLLMDQLPTRTTQFLRVFAKYINTLTGFIMSSFIQLGKEPETTEEVHITPEETLTKVVEMMFFGVPVGGISPITILRQAIVTELGRVFANACRLDMSALPSEAPNISHDLAHSIARWTPNSDPKVVYAFARYHMTGVLRRYALLTFAICGKYDPDDFVGMMHEPEHDRLLSYLRLPKLEQLIHNLGDPCTPEGVAQAELIRKSPHELCDEFRQIDYPGVYRLIRLPNRLDSMFNLPGRKIPMDPAVCLNCGYMCSIQSNEFGAGDVGPCNEHLADCGYTQGIFLLPRRNSVLLLLPHGRGSFVPAPYLDLHGEPDETMRRGRPHYLQPSRYDALMREIWLWNGLPNLVARQLDQNQDSGGWETL